MLSRSQATCDIPGKPKVIYTDIEGEQEFLEELAARMHTQARLVSGKLAVFVCEDNAQRVPEMKWGVRISDDTPHSAQGAREDVNTASDSQGTSTAYVTIHSDVTPPTIQYQIHSETACDEPSYGEAVTSTPEVGASPGPCVKDSDALAYANGGNDSPNRDVDIDSTSTPMPEELQSWAQGIDGVSCSEIPQTATTPQAGKTPHEEAIAVAASQSSGVVKAVNDSTRVPRPRPRPKVQKRAANPEAIYVVGSTATPADVIGVSINTHGGVGKARVVTTDPVDGLMCPGMRDGELTSCRDMRVQPRQASGRGPSPVASQVANEKPSIFSFQPSASCTTSWDMTVSVAMHTAGYGSNRHVARLTRKSVPRRERRSTPERSGSLSRE